MGLFKIICWALIFLKGLRFPPGSSIATILKRIKSFYFREKLRILSQNKNNVSLSSTTEFQLLFLSLAR